VLHVLEVAAVLGPEEAHPLEEVAAGHVEQEDEQEVDLHEEEGLHVEHVPAEVEGQVGRHGVDEQVVEVQGHQVQQQREELDVEAPVEAPPKPGQHRRGQEDVQEGEVFEHAPRGLCGPPCW